MKNYFLSCLFSITFIFVSQAQTIQSPAIVYTDPEVDILTNIHTADFDGDGREDLLISTADINAFWMKNLGFNAFGPVNILYNDEIFGESVKAGDLDNDGDPDVALACSFSNMVLWIENLGNGTFDEATILVEGLDPLTDLVLEDLNEDGLLDIMFSTYSAIDMGGQIFWLENLNGSFSGTKTISLDIADSRKLQYADLNGDGKKDIISASYWDYKFVWFENLGQGAYSSEIVIRDQIDSIRNHCIYAVDLDEDGDMDIVNGIASVEDPIYWLQNDGAGNFTEIFLSDAGTPWDIAAADLDYDGDVDIFCGTSVDRTAVVLDNLGDENFSAPQIIANDIGVIHDIHFSDIDGDLDLDILTTSALSDIALLFKNDADVTVNINAIQENQIKLFPNPSAGVFNLYLDAASIGNDILIYDFQGKIHFETVVESETQVINVPTNLSGAYILVIRDSNKTIIAKKSIQILK